MHINLTEHGVLHLKLMLDGHYFKKKLNSFHCYCIVDEDSNGARGIPLMAEFRNKAIIFSWSGPSRVQAT